MHNNNTSFAGPKCHVFSSAALDPKEYPWPLIAALSPLDGRDRLTIALVGMAHGCSHFFQLVLPPLFPFLIIDFDVSYTQLGALMTVFFLVSGIGQPLAGFLVDRFGARNVLFLGLGLYTLSVFAMAWLPNFGWYFVVIACAALGNCVFHPADYTVLNASVKSSHLGRAFSIHTLGGNLGWALSPVIMLAVAEVAGWRASLLVAAAIGTAVWLSLWLHRDLFQEQASTDKSSANPLGARVLFSSTIVLCFLYFALMAAALIAVQNFIGPILNAIHTTPLVVGGIALTGFLLGASAGVLAGGIAADRTTEHVRLIVIGLAGSAGLVVLLAYLPPYQWALIAALGMAGFLSGLTSPSRDLLVRSATPKGATGRVFGFVYSGLDVGSAFAPITVGVLLDQKHPTLALWLVGGLLAVAIFTVVSIRGKVATTVPATA